VNGAKDRFWRRIPPLGMLTLAPFVICVVTGIMLAPAYLPSSALDSLSLLSLKNPAGVYVRSLHYWSAQVFLILTLAHIVDHLLRRSDRGVRFGVWMRLSVTIPVVIAAMLSGFLLRADAAAAQALPVLRSLLGFFPLIGAGVQRLLTGTGGDLSIIYLHHACTATLIIWLVTVEHSRQIMPTGRSFAWMTPPILLLSGLLVPGLQWRGAPVEKGPWYLVGLQELLHWLQRPQIAVWLGGVGLGLMILLPKLPPHLYTTTRWTLGISALFYAALTMVGVGFRGDGWQWTSPRTVLAGEEDFLSYRAYIPTSSELLSAKVKQVDGRREGCLSCHQGMTGFVAAHDPTQIGCASCHLGNPWTLDKKLAHSGMTLTPGNLSVVNQTCGASNCHTDQVNRVQASLMNTMSGVVAVDKYAFGESSDLNAHFTVAALGHSPADTHLRNLCASCHLGQEKLHPGPINQIDRGGGCSACHLAYDAAAANELAKRPVSSGPLHHPDISIHVPNEACFGCHSRSGRISTNYEGWHETLLDEKTAKASPGWPDKYRVLEDERVFEKHAADVHVEKGMTCVDCHLAAEVMGDGATHTHENDAVRITCVDCHASGKTPGKEYAQLDAETQQILAMRKLNEPGRRFVAAGSTNLAYPNVSLDAAGHPAVSLMNSAKILQPKSMAAVCAGDIHKRLTCTACHTAWAPQCISCHTSFDRKTQGWDHIAGKYVNGTWNEEPAGYLSDAPALGIERSSGSNGHPLEHITTFIPGMILNLKIPHGATNERTTFQRLFAPASPHTIASQARDCRSCHLNPAALGYGRGVLNYVVAGHSGKWTFTPQYARSAEDGLPADAWIGFLQEPRPNLATRKDARPFTLEEQRRILLIGACLSCHEKDRRITYVFSNFQNYRSALSPKCVLPDWVLAAPETGRLAP
jgi:hypothetical protein